MKASRAIALRARGQKAARINVTPMIDVVMCLIVFFLIVGKLAADRLAPVELPEGGAGQERLGADPIIVNVVPIEGGVEVIVDGLAIAPDRLAGALEPGRPVELRASRRLAYGQVRPILDACRAAGVRQIALATEAR